MKHNFEISYTQQGDYLLPDLKLPEQPKVEIGVWGKRHERYIKQHHKIRYFNLLTSCKLIEYLADIDKLAQSTYDSLLILMMQRDGINETLKAKDCLLWTRKVNAIKQQVIEIINHDIIYK